MKIFKKWLQGLLLGISATMLVIMVCLMVWQGFTRYVLGVPALFTEETLRFMMIWMALIGTAYCFGADRHLSLGLIPSMLPVRGQKVLYVFNSIVVIGFAVIIMLLGGIEASRSAMSQTSPIMQLSIGMIYLILPISAVGICILQALNMLLVLTGQKRPTFDPAGDMGEL